MARRACSDGRPVKSPESTRAPYSTNALSTEGISGFWGSSGWTTQRIGRPYFLANSKSRWSCAGTLITAPVPYPASTKFATHTGTCSPVKGFRARRPVSMPSFSAAAAPSPTCRAAARTRSANASISLRLAPLTNFSISGWSGAAAT